MREILFRIWNKKEKRMIEDVHICPQYGWLVMSDNDVLSEICGRVPKEDLIWMQFTGVEDNNGKKIFEGDIVYEGCNGFEAQVVYDKKLGTYRLDGLGEDYIIKNAPIEWEVIGNVFDEKECLDEC